MQTAKILVVEDEVIIARDLERMLVDLGYTPVGHTRHGEKALDLARQLSPDLVLMDIHLAGSMDGTEAALILREVLGIPSVFLTAYAEDGTLARARDAAPLGYVLKPFSERELRSVIQMGLHRHQLERQLQRSEERLRLVLEGSSDAAWDWDLQAGSIFYSSRWWQMAGYAAGEHTSDPELWQRLLHPEDRALTRKLVFGAIENGPDAYQVESRLRHRQGHYVPILTRGLVVRDAEGRAVRVAGTNTDLTERRAAEQALRDRTNELRKSEEYLRTILETEPECVKVMDADGVLLEMNRAGLLAVEADSLEQVRGRSMLELVSPHYHDAFRRGLAEALEGQTVTQIFETIGLKRSRRWMEQRSVRLRAQSEAREIWHVLAITRDISQRMEAERDLKESEAKRWRAGERLWRAHDEERRHIARELHDHAGSTLAAMLLHTRMIENSESSASTRRAIGELAHQLTESLRELSRLARGLHPIALDELGLRPALEQLLHAQTRASGIAAELRVELSEVALSPALELAVYRIAQEALTNVTKHARATRASVQCSVRENELVLTIEDNGSGFDVAQLGQRGEKLGLTSIRERAKLLRGAADIRSEPGHGTTVRATFRLAPRSASVAPESLL